MQSPNLSANEEWCAGGNSDPDGEGFTVESVKVNHGIIHHLHAIASLDPNIQVVLAAGAPDPPEIEAEMMQEVNKLKAAGHHQIVWIREMMPPR